MKKRVRILYGILISVMLTVSGVLLMMSCVNVYRIGHRPFTPDNIAAEFSKIAVVVWITVAIVAIGIILALVLPEEKAKLRAAIDKKVILERLERRIDPEKLPCDVAEKINKEKKLRKILCIAAIALIVAAAIPAAIFAFSFKNFTADHDASVLRACILILPLAFFGIGIATAYVIIESASIDRQLTLVKSAMISASGKSADAEYKKEASPKLATGIRIAVAVLAIVFIVLGIFNGGMADVLSKAINICTECIGLG